MLICITGKTGTGKTTAINYLKGLGYTVFNTDKFVHEQYKIGKKGYKLIKENFGDKYVNEKSVDRTALGELVFNNHRLLKKLNKIMLPLIKQKICKLKSLKKKIFIELAIYINNEKYFENCFDKIILISAPENLKNKNLKKKFGHLRNFPTKRVGTIKNPISSYRIKYGYLVNNSKDKKFFQNEIKKIVEKI